MVVGVVSEVVRVKESESEESKHFHCSHSAYDSVACDLQKTRFLESEAEAEG